MAGLDWITCESCGKRLIYDGECKHREFIDYKPLYCDKCVEKLEKKIEKLKKFDKRRH